MLPLGLQQVLEGLMTNSQRKDVLSALVDCQRHIGQAIAELQQPRTLTRTAGDPACLECRGTGYTTTRSSQGCGTRILCPSCEKHIEIFNRVKQMWEQVK